MSRIEIGAADVRTCVSDSNPDVTYTQRKRADGTWSCDCRGYESHWHCKHVGRLDAEELRVTLLAERNVMAEQLRELDSRIRDLG